MATDYNEMANIIRQIQEMQIQNGLRLKSPLGQGYYPMDNTPAPPGYRLNNMDPYTQMAAMGDDPRKRGINPLNQTEGAVAPRGGGHLNNKFVGVSRGGNSVNPLEAAARDFQAASASLGPERALQAVARRWEIDPAALAAFLKK